MAAISVELENLRAAWRWSVATADIGCLEALLGGLRTIYDARGWYRAITDLATDVLGVLDTLERTPERDVLALAMRSDQARALTAMDGYTAEVEAAYERLLESVQSTDVPQVYPILRGLATLFSFRNQHDKAIEVAARILRLGEEQDDPVIQMDGYLLRGSGRGFTGRVDDGFADLEAGIAIAAPHPPRRPPRPAGSRPAGRDPHRDVAHVVVGRTARHLPGPLPTCGRDTGRSWTIRPRWGTGSSTPRSCACGAPSRSRLGSSPRKSSRSQMSTTCASGMLAARSSSAPRRSSSGSRRTGCAGSTRGSSGSAG